MDVNSVGNSNTNSRISNIEYSAFNIQINSNNFQWLKKLDPLSLLKHSNSQHSKLHLSPAHKTPKEKKALVHKFDLLNREPA